jgi:hypothetical protein
MSGNTLSLYQYFDYNFLENFTDDDTKRRFTLNVENIPWEL